MDIGDKKKERTGQVENERERKNTKENKWRLEKTRRESRKARKEDRKERGNGSIDGARVETRVTERKARRGHRREPRGPEGAGERRVRMKERL